MQFFSAGRHLFWEAWPLFFVKSSFQWVWHDHSQLFESLSYLSRHSYRLIVPEDWKHSRSSHFSSAPLKWPFTSPERNSQARRVTGPTCEMKDEPWNSTSPQLYSCLVALFDSLTRKGGRKNNYKKISTTFVWKKSSPTRGGRSRDRTRLKDSEMRCTRRISSSILRYWRREQRMRHDCCAPPTSTGSCAGQTLRGRGSEPQ